MSVTDGLGFTHFTRFNIFNRLAQISYICNGSHIMKTTPHPVCIMWLNKFLHLYLETALPQSDYATTRNQKRKHAVYLFSATDDDEEDDEDCLKYVESESDQCWCKTSRFWSQKNRKWTDGNLHRVSLWGWGWWGGNKRKEKSPCDSLTEALTTVLWQIIHNAFNPSDGPGAQRDTHKSNNNMLLIHKGAIS